MSAVAWMQLLWLSLGLLGMIVFLAGCQTDPDKPNKPTQPVNPPAKQVNVPSFNEDSCYHYIQKQVDFGPRPINSEAHDACADWLVASMKQWADTVYVQKATFKAYDGVPLRITNIISSFNPEQKNRILLCAHWDSRPWADEGSERRDEPILGANDGGSGVGVWMEVARLLKQQPVGIGVDIIFFDAEDYGKSHLMDSYCLGTQYWATHKHVSSYHARFGILLDMVGAKDATFFMEGYSMNFAPSVVKKVWNTAAQHGYSRHFIYEPIIAITDDHLYVNNLAGIPCIDIIQRDVTTATQFGAYWHTHFDDMKVINKQTLKAVGETMLHVIYGEDAGV